MSKTPPFRRIYEEVSANRNFDAIAEYRKPEVWSAMSAEDRELLALLLVSHGEQQLAEGNSSVTETFALAGKVAPDSVPVWLRQGRVFATQKHNIRCLVLSCKALERVIKLDADCLDAWFALGKVLVRMGIFHNDSAYFRRAETRFEDAYNRFSKDGNDDAIPCDLMWQWGLCWFYHGKASGEAMDFRTAIAKFQRAADKGINKAVFWNDYGNAMVDLGCLIGRHELLYDASQLYHKATEECSDYFPAWLNLACCYQELYEISGAEDFFLLSDESFVTASDLNQTDVSLWIKWGMLYVNSGRINRDVRRLQTGIEKLKHADETEPNHGLVLERLGESMALLGAYTESLELLKKGEEKVLQGLALVPESANGWYVYGFVLNELGHYFSDDEYYFAAIDKFQYGAAQHPRDDRFYYGMALSYNYVADLRSDPYMLEKSLESFATASELSEGKDSQFWNDWGMALMRMTEMTGSQRYLMEAIAKFEYAIQLQGGDEDPTGVDSQLLYNYGCSLDFLGDFTDEETHYQRAINILNQVAILDPDYVHARYNLGLAWSHLGELTSEVDAFHNGVEQFRAAVNADPEDEHAWNDWGLAVLNLARLTSDPACAEDSEALYAEAESKLLHASGLGSLQAFYNLACLYSLTGKLDASMHYVQRAQGAGALPALDDILHDEWLDALRETEEFKAFVNQLANKVEE